jgi:hypothetical protein
MHRVYQLPMTEMYATYDIFARDSAFSYGMKLNIGNATGRPHTPFLALGVVRGVGGWNMHSQSFIFRNDPPPPIYFSNKTCFIPPYKTPPGVFQNSKPPTPI